MRWLKNFFGSSSDTKPKSKDIAAFKEPVNSLDEKQKLKFVEIEKHEKTFYATSTPGSIKGQITKLKKKLSVGRLFQVEKAHYALRIEQLENLLKIAEERQRSESAKKAQAVKEKKVAEKKAKLAEVNNVRKQLILEEVEKHYATLRRNFNRVYRVNDYGGVLEDKRPAEFREFLTSVGFKVFYDPKDDFEFGNPTNTNPKHLNRIAFKRELKKLQTRIEKDKNREEKAGFDPDTIPENGHDFEHWVAENLKPFGWQANVSVGSGDQGIDVVAEKNGKTVGIQCKLYSGSVGNKAVQEAQSGSMHYQVDYAVVISNAKYTKSAHQLAKSTGVLLLSHKDIPQLENILKI